MKKQYVFSSHRTKNTKNINKQKPKFPALVRDIIRISDVVLEILDARFVEETRNVEFEGLVKKQGKKIIYVLNKADLVKSKNDFEKLGDCVYVSAKNGAGVKELKNKIKESVKKLDLGKKISLFENSKKNSQEQNSFGKKRAQVGIIGYPNTGKSTLINLLTKRNSAGTGSESGFTKGMQKIRLTKNILILDTPGVIPESEYSHVKRDAIQKQVKVGARTIDKIKDPDIVVMNLMKEYSKEIEKFYKIKSRGNYEVLIKRLGKKKHFLKKGGEVDEDRTSRLVIKDWQIGKIKL